MTTLRRLAPLLVCSLVLVPCSRNLGHLAHAAPGKRPAPSVDAGPLSPDETAVTATRASIATAQSLTVDEIVESHVEARGGLDRIRAIRTLVYSGGMYHEPGYTGSGEAFMAFARPYFRVVGNPESPGAVMEGYDGAAWEWYADPGVVIRTVGPAAGATRRGADFEGPLVDHRRKGHRIELANHAEIDGRPAYRLQVTLRDGFRRDYFLDADSFLVVAERQAAPIHAFGEPVRSETRIEDYREVAGVLFPHRFVERELGSGRMLSRMQWKEIEANPDLPDSWFSPPEFTRSTLQQFLELLYSERTDARAVLWSYDQLRRFHPAIDTRSGIEWIGYQMVKMGDHEGAIALLRANLADHPGAASSAFGLGRALADAGRIEEARRAFERALELDPEHPRAAEALEELGSRDSR